MTDFEKVKQLFDELGVEYELDEKAERVISGDHVTRAITKCIIIESGGRYYTVFRFALNDKFFDVDIFE
jgi:hypothetical protein